MSSDALTIERTGPVLVLHLDDGKANALSFELIAAISAAVSDAEADPEIGAVVIHGRERRFSGGFDLDVMFGGDMARIIELVADGGALVRHLYGSGVPVVAARMGGLVDLVSHEEWGLLYDAFDAGALARCLASLLDDPERLDGFVARLPEVKSMERDARDWDARYREVLGARGGRTDPRP